MWTEISKREYELHSFDPIPKWPDQLTVAKYMWWASQGQGWVAKRREVNEGLVTEKVLWKPRAQ